MHFVAFMLQNQPDPEVVRRMLPAIMGGVLIVVLIFLVILILPFWFICKKAGFSPWLSLLNIIPLGNLILIYVLAFSDWTVVPAPTPAWMPPQYPNQPPPQG